MISIDDHDITVHLGDVREHLALLEPGSVQCIVTSPPYYGLRDYGVGGQIGLEPSPAEYVAEMVAVFAAARGVLADDGVLWLNLGDSYNAYNGNRGESRTGFSRNEPMPSLPRGAGLTAKNIGPKNLLGIPWRVAFALQDDGWTLRNAVIWNKPNAMPESVTDRLSCRYEHLFLFSKSRRYWFDLDPIREPLLHPDALDGSRVFGGSNKADALTTGSAARRTGNRYGVARPWANSEQGDDHDAASPRGRNPGDVWTIATSPFPGAHFATMPPELARRCILAGCREGGTVLDPFAGSGTTLKVARSLGRKSIGIELNPAYVDIIRDRIGQTPLDFGASA
jgi:DNA modification methylase